MSADLIDLPFTRGLDESTDETVLSPPGMTELVNYHLTRAGRLEHRLGVKDASLASVMVNQVGNRPGGNKSQAVHGRFLAAGGHGYVAGLSGVWTCMGSVPRFVPHDSFPALQGTADDFSGMSCASLNGYLVVAGVREVSGATRVRVFDEGTRACVFESGLDGGCVRLVASGIYVVALRMDLSTGELIGSKLDLSTFPISGFSSDVVILTGAATGGFDATLFDVQTTLLVSYYDGTNAVVAQVDTATLAVTDSAAVTDGAGVKLTTCLTITAQPTVYLAWLNATTRSVCCAVFDGSLTQIGSTQTMGTSTATSLSGANFHPVIGVRDIDHAVIGWTDTYNSGPYYTFRTTFRDIHRSASLWDTYGPLYGYYLASKPFRAPTSLPFVETTSQPAVWLANYNPNITDTDRSYFLMMLGFFENTVLLRNGASSWEMSACPSGAVLWNDLMGTQRQVPEVVISSDGRLVWQTVFQEAFRGLGTSTPQRAGKIHRFGDAALTLRARTRCIVPCNGSFAVLGGAPRYFGGDRIVELGISHGPTIVDATPSGGGAMTSSATYRYVLVLEYFDGLGQRHLSYPSSPFSVLMGGTDTQVELDIAVPAMWAFPNVETWAETRQVTVRAYRTAANVGTVFRFAPAVTAANGALAGPLTEFGRVTYNDDNSDADIAGNEAVYVQVGNARSNYRAPPCRFGCEHEGRLVVAGLWNPCEFSCSKLFFPGEGPKFADSVAFTGVCPEPITGLASLDGALVVFAERSIYIVTGDGPLDDGTGSFSTPRKLPGRIGCLDWRSVVVTEAGVYFRAAQGICLLPRGLGAPQFVGAPVQNQLRKFPDTLGAATVTRTVSNDVADHDSEQVMAWLVADAADPDAVKIFVFSQATQTWSEYELPGEDGNLQTVIGTWTDLVNGTDVLAFARETLSSSTVGSVLVENPASGFDRDISASFEPLLSGRWKTGKVFPFGFGGRGSVRRLRLVGDCLSATTLTPTIYSDANAVGYAGSTLTLAAGRFDVALDLRQRDLSWLQVAIADPATGSGNRGAGVRFNGLALEVEMEPGMARTNPGNRSI